MFGLGVPELLIIFAIIMLLFGYSRLPQLGKGLGQGIRNFREGLRGGEHRETPDQDRTGGPPT